MAGILTGINDAQPQSQPQPQPVRQAQAVPHEYYNPYGHGYGYGYGYGYGGGPGGGGPAVPATPSNQYYSNPGTETIQGDTVQTGTFKGHGTGAKIQGGFTASGNIQ